MRPSERLALVITVYDDRLFVSVADYENAKRYPVLVPARFSTGRKYSAMPRGLVPKGGTSVHRENIRQVVYDATV